VAALKLLEASEGPVVLIDFPQDAPASTGEPIMLACPYIPKEEDTNPTEVEKLCRAFKSEMASLRPWDADTVLESVRRTGRAVVVEEAWRTGGFGAEVASTIQERAFDYLDAPVARVGGADVPMPYARDLEQAAIPSEESVVKAVRDSLAA
ncbi:MAG: hypothetical protein IIB33_03175, partial [Chloroflexi bacterium]|nr:hypothetical protein [Chloroflexota bacterium]